jgi:hypothetical protein
MKMLLCFLVFLPAPLSADSLCEGVQIQPQIEKRTPLPNDVNYFLRGAPKTGEVGIASLTGNLILNARTGAATQISGTEDPVLSPDGQMLARPVDMIYDATQKKFISTEDPAHSTPSDLSNYLLKGGHVFEQADDRFQTLHETDLSIDDLKAKNVSYMTSVMTFFLRDRGGSFHLSFVDEGITENYQSIGQLPSDGESKYRVLYNSMYGVKYRDYSVHHGTLRPLGSSQLICGKSMEANLPMISKNGASFAIFTGQDKELGEMLVYDLDAQMQCHLSDRIPASVGKVDFSPNGRLLAFHVDESDARARLFKVPSSTDHMGVYIWDRDHPERSLVPIHVAEKEDNYFPVFLSNDELAYISATKDDGQQFFLNVVKFKLPSSVLCSGCVQDPQKSQWVGLLGAMYAQKCGGYDKSYGSALAYFSRLTPQRCQELAQSFTQQQLKTFVGNQNFIGSGWDVDRLQKIRSEDINKACSLGP